MPRRKKKTDSSDIPTSDTLNSTAKVSMPTLVGNHSANKDGRIESIAALSKVFGVSRQTIYRWKEEGMPIEIDSAGGEPTFDLYKIRRWRSTQSSMAKKIAEKKHKIAMQQAQEAQRIVQEYNLESLYTVPDCRGENCKVYHMCQYPKDGACKLRENFISEVMAFYCRELPKERADDQVTLMHIGNMLIPLWDTRCMIHLEKLVMYEVMIEEKGFTKINPLVRAEADVIRQILQVERQLGLIGFGGSPNVPKPVGKSDGNSHGDGGPNKETSNNDQHDDVDEKEAMEWGQAGYYEQLEGTHEGNDQGTTK